MVGQVVGQLTVLSRYLSDDTKSAYWRCRCQCGEYTIAAGFHLRAGRIKSCGCLRKSQKAFDATLGGRIVAALKEHGEMTVEVLADVLGERWDLLRDKCRLLSQEPKSLRKVHISGWEVSAPVDGGRKYPRPIYKAGKRPDAPKPSPAQWVVPKFKIGARPVTSIFELGSHLGRKAAQGDQDGPDT